MEPCIVPRDSVTLSEMLRQLIRDPWQQLGRRWNYKSAITSSLFRGLLFFATNIAAGLPAALAALSTEFWFRLVTAGYYGALTQAFRRVEPARTAMIAAMIVLPTIGHGLEFIVHWLSGTPNLSASVAVSVLFTVVSTAFNLFAMRRGALIIGDGSSSLLQDFRRMPALIGAFVVSILTPFLAPLKWCPPIVLLRSFRRGGPSGPPWARLTTFAKATVVRRSFMRRRKPRPYRKPAQVAAPEVKPEGISG